MKGRSKPFTESKDSEFVLALDGVQLAKYFDYSPVKLPIKIESGALDTDLTLVFRQEQGQTPKLLLSGIATLKNMKVKESADLPLVSFKALEVAIGSADLLGGKFAIERIALDTPEINARATRSGTLNWLDLLPKAAVESKTATPAAPSNKAKTARPLPRRSGFEAVLSSGTCGAGCTGSLVKIVSLTYPSFALKSRYGVLP